MYPFYHLMLITNKQHTPLNKYLDFIKYCTDGGITSLQLREKNLEYNQLLDFGSILKEILAPYNIFLVINDNPQLAKDLQCTAIHLGRNDIKISKAQEILDHQAKIGISIETIEDLYHANAIDNISYVTASAVFPTKNKNNLKTFWGLEGINKLSTLSKYPLTAIGGITLQNTKDIILNGAKGIALIGALHNSTTPYNTTKLFRIILDNLIGEINDRY